MAQIKRSRTIDSSWVYCVYGDDDDTKQPIILEPQSMLMLLRYCQEHEEEIVQDGLYNVLIERIVVKLGRLVTLLRYCQEHMEEVMQHGLSNEVIEEMRGLSHGGND